MFSFTPPQSKVFNPFNAPACNISGLKDARACLQTVHFPVLQHISFQFCAFG